MEQAARVSTNATSFFPSPSDLLLVVPRLLAKASSLGDMVRAGGSVIAQPTTANLTNGTAAITSQFVQESIAAAGSVATASQNDVGMYQALKNIASLFTYLTSKYALVCFALVRAPGHASPYY